jgi:hypothetical protein
MKIQNILRTNLVVMGFAAAALLTAGSARAQEIENTVWADGPNVAPFAQSVSAEVVNTANAVVTDAQVATRTAAAIAPVVADEASVAQISKPNAMLMALCLVCLALGTLYIRAQSKRIDRSSEAQSRHARTGVALS